MQTVVTYNISYNISYMKHVFMLINAGEEALYNSWTFSLPLLCGEKRK